MAAEREREKLRSRLTAAELVCLVLAAAPSGPLKTVAQKAVHQAWSEWRDRYGEAAKLDPGTLEALAKRRDDEQSGRLGLS
jgi:hypothetical protein